MTRFASNERASSSEVHPVSILESRRALRREHDRLRHRQRRDAMSDEALALFRERCRAQYRRRQERRCAAAEAPATPATNRALWPACLHAGRSSGLASSQLGSTSYAAALGSAQPLADLRSVDVVGVFREHAVREASRIAGFPTLCDVSTRNETIDVSFAGVDASGRQPPFIPSDDFIDIQHSDEDWHNYVSGDASMSVPNPSCLPVSHDADSDNDFNELDIQPLQQVHHVFDSVPSSSTNPPSTSRRSRRSSVLQRSSPCCAKDFTDSPDFARFVLPEPTVCRHCGAKLFLYETSSLCCKNGAIVLPYQAPPPELLHLYTADTADAIHFRDHIRSYNHVFAFTSMGVHLDSNLATANQGVYTYRAQGAIYHRIGSLFPEVGQRPRFLQMYLYDTEHELQNRLSENDTLNPRVLAILKNVLDTHNAFVHVLRRVSELPDITEVRLQLRESRSYGSQYILPTASQVAAILIGGDDPADACDRDVIVQTQGGRLLNVPDTAGFYDPLQYPLLHPYGEFGWDLQLHQKFGGRLLSCRAYYAYILQMRADRESLILRSHRLLQQFVVDTYVKISTQQLRYIREHQVKLRAELYKGLQDSVINGETQACNIGRRVILPASYIGSPRDMHHRYYDAMAIVQKYGRPDLFITITCNPKWEEILRQLHPGETSQDRPDIVTRVFHSKLKELQNDLFKKGVLGKVIAHVHVVEFQKRGLPHAHILLILSSADKLRSPADYDSVVRAEIPDQETEPDLFRIVMRHMIHGPCGELDKEQPCLKDGHCKKLFPKGFCDFTTDGADSYPLYRRPRSGPQVRLRNGIVIDNRWVVPYNPWLLRKYDCHINVEVCSTIKCVKYLYKYVYKGSDRCSMEVNNDRDEVKKFLDGRWLSSHEALWRIFRFKLNEIYPAVYSMQVHLHNMHEVRFPDDQRLETLLRSDTIRKTMLTEFFAQNLIDPAARQYLYREFPEHYTWCSTSRTWNTRVGHKKVIGRLHTATPADPERYYLRLLLNHVRGPTSYEHLRTVVENGISTTYLTFKDAAEKLGLLEKDHATRECLLEASSLRMPSALIHLFATLLVFCSPIDALSLWNEFQPFMIQQYPQQQTSAHATYSVLADLEASLSEHNKTLSEYGLPELPSDFTDPSAQPKDIMEELLVQTPADDLQLYQKLNRDQSYAFHVILDSAVRGMDDSQKLFFIDGPGGTGKTFLYRSLLAHFRREGFIALATATSGLAAIMMPGGRTAHSRFKIPVPITATSTCRISHNSNLAQLLRRAKIIIWDEATMAHRHIVEALDRTLRDIMSSNELFGGKLIVFGGDFRQVLPVVPQGSQTDIINSCLRHSYIWPSVHVISLEQNMRALQDPDFSDFLLRVGNGTEPSSSEGSIALPQSMLLPWVDDNSIENLISELFPSLSTRADDSEFMISRVLLTTTNEYVDDVNARVLAHFPGEICSYFSFDSVENDPRALYQLEFLNSITQATLPPYKLDLKVGCPIMLTRNIEPKSGLCNGTRLLCRHFYPNLIDAEIVTGAYKGTTFFVHRIPLNSPPEMKLPFTLTRKQFPVRLSFALTIHKSQGQTIPFVGIYLPHNVFTHGQLYVALSRGKSAKNTKILVRNGTAAADSTVVTKNIVYTEVLS